MELKEGKLEIIKYKNAIKYIRENIIVFLVCISFIMMCIITNTSFLAKGLSEIDYMLLAYKKTISQSSYKLHGEINTNILGESGLPLRIEGIIADNKKQLSIKLNSDYLLNEAKLFTYEEIGDYIIITSPFEGFEEIKIEREVNQGILDWKVINDYVKTAITDVKVKKDISISVNKGSIYEIQLLTDSYNMTLKQAEINEIIEKLEVDDSLGKVLEQIEEITINTFVDKAVKVRYIEFYIIINDTKIEASIHLD